MKNDNNLAKIYKTYIKQGDKYYFNTDRGYLIALEYYLMAYEKHPNSALLNYKIADCYLHTMYKYKTLLFALKAFELNPNVTPDIDLVVGMAYHQRQNFDKAIEFFEKFKIDYKGQNTDVVAMVNRRIQECNNGKSLVGENLFEIANLGPGVNSEYAEYVPLIKADQSFILFTGRRPQNMKRQDTSSVGGSTKKLKGERLSGYDYDYYEDIFKTERASDTSWNSPQRFNYSTDSKKTHDACVSLAFDGQTIYNYRSINQGDLYFSTLVGGQWTELKPMNGINSLYRESHVTTSYDNKTAYFVSDRPGGFGGKDIWKSTRKDNGDWNEPENLGPAINTAYEEDGVFIHPDGKTLYFSSQGHQTMGGYDIFQAKFENETWSIPENVGYPINSPDDDIYFVLTADGQHAYLSSVREGGYGMQDIYMISPYENKKQKVFDVVMFKGFIVDKESKIRLNANVEITDNSTGKKVFSSDVDEERGYSVSLPAAKITKTYTISVEVDGYNFYTESFVVEKGVGMDYEKTVEMEKLIPGSEWVLRNLFFDFGKSNLEGESMVELDKILKVLNEYPKMNIQIEGYTDNVGLDTDNKILSEQRANAVKDYFILKGLNPKRIVNVLGFGELQPIATNETEEGRAKNRRVIFRVVD